MRVYKKKADCCGCAACVSVCKYHAIKMRADQKGFFYPEIDQDKCVNCGQCTNRCPANVYKWIEGSSSLPLACAVRNKDEMVRKSSSSGGVFYELATHTLKNGGVVYGAVFDKHFQVVHRRGLDLKAIRDMQGSKYVQSSTEGIFECVKKDLAKGKNVLFTGCPCQADALKCYLGEYKQEQLLICDLVCHGVASPKVWRDYLKCQSEKGQIREINFRDKSAGWHSSVMYIRTDKTKYMESNEYDSFFRAFSSNYILRKSCYSCKYTNLNRLGDITIGDFWGIEHVCPQIDDNRGVSLVLLNSVKGADVFSDIKNHFILKEVGIKDSLQPQLQHPSALPKKYEEFWRDYEERGFRFICRKYLRGGFSGKLKRIFGLLK